MRQIDVMKSNLIYGSNYGVPEDCICTAIIEEIPTIKIEPVRYGEWTEMKSGEGMFDYYFVCSECHKNTPDRAYPIAPNYCPNCGAKMDGATRE